MLYHYTTIPAMRSILRDAGTRGQMCFWATRYDCLADAEEFKLGVETIRRLLPEVETSAQGRLCEDGCHQRGGREFLCRVGIEYIDKVARWSGAELLEWLHASPVMWASRTIR